MFSSIVKRASGILARGYPSSCSLLSPSLASTTTISSSGNHHLQHNIVSSALSSIAVRFRSGRSKRGLYDGKDVRFGNQRSFSMRATRRKFKPNVFLKRVYSETLDSMIRFHVTAAALRSIDKAGGLDNYLFKQDDLVVGSEGWKIKKAIIKRRKNLAYFARKKLEREAAEAAETTTTTTEEKKMEQEV
jgi:large subunit ribosomal protein L28